jgi:hypothetical protein
MSKKYIPSFLRGEVLKEGALKEGALSALKEGALKVIEPPTRNFSQERNNSNTFTRVTHDYRKEKPVEVPKLAPATLASITSLTADNATTKGSGSFASKFAEQVRNSENPNYQKPVDLSSVDDFPALGAVRQKNNMIVPPLKVELTEKLIETLNISEKPRLTELKPTTITNAPSFAEMASLWAKKKEHDDRENAEFTRRKDLEEEKMRQAARLMKKQPILGSISRRIREEGCEEEEGNAYVNPDEHSSLGGGSNYEYDEDDSFEGEDSNEERHDDDEDDNPNVGWDGRRKEDLY